VTSHYLFVWQNYGQNFVKPIEQRSYSTAQLGNMSQLNNGAITKPQLGNMQARKTISGYKGKKCDFIRSHKFDKVGDGVTSSDKLFHV
jgi:hypothetical protein